MTKSTITRERLEQLADNNTICKVSWDERIELAQIALAAMDSEPVAWTSETALSDVACEETSMIGQEGVVGSIPLYRHAQPTVDSEPVGYFRRYDPDFDALITQCDKGAQDSFPLYLHAQSGPIEANIVRDAQRYRFLRDKDAFGDDGEPGLASWDELIELDMNEFDAAIDARMAHPSVDFLTLDNALQKQDRRRCKDRNCNKQIFGYSVDGLCEGCYAAVSQQPVPVVTEDVRQALRKMDDEIIAELDAEESACRAAMLQAGYAVRDLSTPVDPQVAEYEQNVMQAGNSPVWIGIDWAKGCEPANSSVIPDTWIPVSEQMPPSRHEVLVGRWWGEKPRWCCKWATYIPGHPDAQSSGWLIPGGSWTPTHWMELPAAPQEVK